MKAKLGLLMLVLMMGTGCQRTAAPGSGQVESLQSASCAKTATIDPSQLAIVGADGATPGEVVNYRLNQNVGCADAQTVSWKTVSAQSVGEGGLFVTQMRKAGAYVVTAEVQAKGQATPVTISKQTTVSDQLALMGPQVGMTFVENTYSLMVPADVTVSSAQWSFGDGSAEVSALSQVTHAFLEVGSFTVTARVTLASGAVQTLSQPVQIITVREGYECMNQLAVSGATSVGVNVPTNLTLFVPSCLTARITHLSWTFGDGSANGTAQSVQHAYPAVGSYPVSVSIFQNNSAEPLATLNTVVHVTAVDPEPTPEEPDQNQCASVGLSRQITGELYTEEVACGVKGHRTNSFRDTITESCATPADLRVWVESGRVKTLVNEGACEGQACAISTGGLSGIDLLTSGLTLINGQYYLLNGTSKTFYSNASPAGACTEVGTVRSCANGVLNGSSAHTNLVCHAGCAGIGPSGTVLVGQVTGQELAPKVCAFGETGINDVFAQLSDKLCTDGVVTSQNVSRGELTLAGVCPSYALQPTANFGACSADCGGTQAQIFACTDAAGHVVGGERCVGQEAPVITRLCDANPAAVHRADTLVEAEEGGQSKTCPKNQIGIVVQSRDKITTQTYSCVNHAVTLVDTNVTHGAWTNQEFCRDYVAYRCSQDSLSNTDSSQRYLWMLKCQDQVPAIKEFLAQFESYEAGTDAKPYLLYNNRMVYATFMNRATSPEKVWKAPIKADASCEVPSTAYIAAVCTASCATPDQQILAEAKQSRRLAYAPIGQAWAQQLQAVATLTAGSSLESKRVVKTAVDQWVTEMVDGEHEILDFRLKSGGVLRLTPNHPVVTDQGTIKLARDFKAGENLMRLGGERDPIVDITSTVHNGKVYNLFVKSVDPKKNVVVTNGYLNGTAYFQNDGNTFVNQQILRRELIRGALK